MKRVIFLVGSFLALISLVTAETEKTTATVLPAGSQVVKTKDIEQLPVARDLKSLLSLVPGIMIDQTGAGNSNGGVQPKFWGFGTGPEDTQWLIDGIILNNLTSPGGLANPMSFDAVEELQVISGGISVEMGSSAGAVLNIVTKRGGEKWSGAARLESAPFGFRKDPTDTMADQSLLYPKASSPYQLGIDLGGPIIKDKLWWFGSWAIQDINRKTEKDLEDTSWLMSGYSKADFQLGKTGGSVNFEADSKKRTGGGFLPPAFQDLDSLWEIRDPSGFFSGHFNAGFGKFGLQARTTFDWGNMSRVPGGAAINTTTGHSEGNEFKIVDGKKAEGSSPDYQSNRNSVDLSMDGNYFLEGVLGGDHEIRFGADYYTADTSSQCFFPNQRISYVYRDNPSGNYVGIHPDSSYDAKFKRTSAYMQDTITFGKLTAAIGIRYDKETSEFNPATYSDFTWYEPGNTHYHDKPVFKDKIPSYQTPGFTIPVPWKFVSPRLSLTYDISGDGKSVVKFSAGRYMSQGNTNLASYYIPVRTAWAPWNDQNKDEIPQMHELGQLTWLEFAPYVSDDTKLQPVDFDPDYNCPILNEITLAFEKALTDDIAVSLTGFYRKKTRLSHFYDSAGRYVPYYKGLMYDGTAETKANWRETGTVDVGGVPVIVYNRIHYPIGRYYTNLKNSSEDFTGASLIFNKRLANRWMLRGNFTFQDWTWNGDQEDILDLNNFNFYNEGAIAPVTDDFGFDGNFVNANWIFQLSSIYQLPFGVNVSSLLMGRSGNPQPLRRRVMLNNGPRYLYEPGTKLGDERLPTFWMLNLGLEKTLKVTDAVTASVFFDMFNVLNSQTAIRNDILIGAETPGIPDPIMFSDPRIFRLGAKIEF